MTPARDPKQTYINIRKIKVKLNFLYFLTNFDFFVKYCLPEVREVSRKLPGARGFAVSEYGPVASHGDPIQPQNYTFVEFVNSVVMLSGSENDYVGTRNQLGARKMIM